MYNQISHSFIYIEFVVSAACNDAIFFKVNYFSIIKTPDVNNTLFSIAQTWNSNYNVIIIDDT